MLLVLVQVLHNVVLAISSQIEFILQTMLEEFVFVLLDSLMLAFPIVQMELHAPIFLGVWHALMELVHNATLPNLKFSTPPRTDVFV